MTHDEIISRIKEIDNQIKQLEQERSKLQEYSYQLTLEKMKVLIGHCFKGNEKDLLAWSKDKSKPIYYFKITDVPSVTTSSLGADMTNLYQIPCVMIGPSGSCPYTTTVFSRCNKADNPLEAIRKEYQEITAEEFAQLAH